MRRVVRGDMRFRVLGTLEVGGGPGRVAPLRSGKLRRLLAVLLVEAGEVVSVSRLVDVLWSGDVPTDPSRAVHNLVSRLRAWLGTGEGELVTRPPGYLLVVERGQLDATRFEDLLGEARGLVAENPKAAADVLDDALSLWRGPAYAEFAEEEFARVEAVRLEELRLTAREERVEAALALGHHHEVIGRLETLVAAEPLRERPLGQLMVALYRSGRAVEALESYRAYRTRLNEELGLEPSPALARLEAAVLRQDPALDAPPPPAVPDTSRPEPPPSGEPDGEHLVASVEPLRALEAFAHNLPVQLSSFVGRADELAAVQTALDRSRLVTLTGAGGSGKTRLALQVAADRVEQHPDGVWLVDLAGLSDPEFVPQAALTALRAPDRPGQAVFEALSGYLASRDLLMVLDNCEHLIEAAAQLTDRVLRAAPQVRLLATSREPLNVDGEVSWRVPSLSLPEATKPQDAVAEGSEAVKLFVERAQAANPGFEVTADNLPFVVAICRRLDGLPLAIELAAARARVLSVEDIAARVHDRFALLTGGTRTALPRQRTLEATVAWSYELLDSDERLLFARLSVFAGAFTLDAVEEVCSGHGLERERVVDLLTALVDKSLVAVHPNGGASRYRLLETLRDYARKRLAESPDRAAVRAAHRRWAVAYAEEAGRQLFGPQQARWRRDIAATMDDLRAAIEQAVDDGDVETALRIVVALDFWWMIANSLREGRRRYDRLLPAAEGVDPGVLGRALSHYGRVLSFFGETEIAVEILERSQTLLSEAKDARAQAFATLHLAGARWASGETDVVRELLREAVAAFDKLNDPLGLGLGLWHLTLWELEFGAVEEAANHTGRLRALADHTPAPMNVAHASEAAALVARAHRDLSKAQRHFGAAIEVYGEIGNATCLAHCLEHTALWALDAGKATCAGTLLGAAEALREDIAAPAVPPFERMWHDSAVAAARAALGTAAFTTAWQGGRALDFDEAFTLGRDSVGRETVEPTSDNTAAPGSDG